MTPWTAARQASLSITNSQSLLKLMSIESVIPSNHLILCSLPLPSSIFPAATAAKSLQLCLTLYDPIDGSPPGSPVPGILQARTLEWVAISFSNAWKWKVKVKSLSPIRLLATPWTAAYQAPPSMGFSRQEYWRGCRCLLWSISPSNEYSGLISFRMTDWLSLLTKGLSRVFSNTTVQKHKFFGTQLSL